MNIDTPRKEFAQEYCKVKRDALELFQGLLQVQLEVPLKVP